MTSTTNPLRTTVSRRAVLGAAASGAALAPLAAGASTPAAATTLPLVTPVWSEQLRRSYGVAVHPNLGKTGYAYVDAWAQQVAAMNATYIRGRYAPQLDATAQTIARCRALGLKWLMLVIPEDWSMSPAELRTTLAHIRDNAADVCIGIEGMNEPNHNRDGSEVRADWAAATVVYQKVIKEFVAATPSMAHVTVVGPSLQMGGTDPLAAFLALADAGIRPYMDEAGMHSYPGGMKPDNNVAKRLGWVATAWGQLPTLVSETGYHTATNAPLVGHRPAPTDVAATYGPRSLLEYASRGCRSVRFELLDDPDAANATAESNFGLLEATGLAPSTWTPKAEYGVMQAFLGSLKDSAASYTPAPVPLQVVAPSTVKWTLVAKSDGTVSLLTYLNASVYDAVKRVRLTVAPVDVTIIDRAGTRVVKVGPQVTSVPVR